MASSPATRARGLETRQRVLVAAMAEFAQHGVDGARINRIAERAWASKERIHAWFGDKDAVFATVMETGLKELSRVVPITPNLVGYAVRPHDTFAARPDPQRIAAWAWLHERGHAEPASEKRVAGYRHKIEVIRDAQRASARSAQPDASAPGHRPVDRPSRPRRRPGASRVPGRRRAARAPTRRCGRSRMPPTRRRWRR
ncbi:TetR family transcriptional regulator [Micromonospora sp. RP3T]|uniref:TetR family transcriptional regulator n=1 Tax=Micromonospora sp. RP3T TaxID=2135446 RepID=UPI000D15C426|nr:TetR family transcriptional regulator [Micromonospora sp. RP3T]PTA45158.1 hypothetical protein C8054_16245 [Micromonospora sp. RP3T]